MGWVGPAIALVQGIISIVQELSKPPVDKKTFDRETKEMRRARRNELRKKLNESIDVRPT